MAGDLQVEPASAAEKVTAAGLERPSAEAVVAIADAAPVLIWSAAFGGADDWHSGAWSVYTGLPAEELAGDGWVRAVHPEDAERCKGIRVASFEARSPFSLDLRLRRHDGEYRWMADPKIAVRGTAVIAG